MTGQIHKTCYPELGCSGNLNSSGTVYLVNVGTSCIGGRTGLTAADVIHGGRNGCSSLRYGKHITWRRAVASRKSDRKQRNGYCSKTERFSSIGEAKAKPNKSLSIYYGSYYKSALYPILRHFNRILVRWVTGKYKRFRHHRRRAKYWLGRVANKEPNLFPHWRMGIKPSAGQQEPNELRGSRSDL